MFSLKKSSIFLLTFFLNGCIFKSQSVSSATQYEVIIHQLRVEVEEIKHHIHTTVVQMNILTNKMVNSEDTLFELKQRELISQKQALESNSARLTALEKELELVSRSEEKASAQLMKLEQLLTLYAQSLEQTKKKIHELEKIVISTNTK
jgi:hypothetical protein